MAEDSEDKTEAATPQRLSRARAEGQAPVSHELASFANLAAAMLVIMAAGPQLAMDGARQLGALLAHAGRTDSAAGVITAARQAAGIGAGLFIPLAAAVVATGAGVVLAQTQFALRLTALAPDISRINPAAGFGRLFSANHGVDALKSLLKISIMSVALWFILSQLFKSLPGSLEQNLSTVAGAMKTGMVTITGALVVIQAAISIGDIAWTQVHFAKTMKMTREEIKQEHKDADGDPHVKARRKAMRNAMARQNLQKAMERATVVVTNPTHYAVALAYERNSNTAPKIVAKGVDELAARIRELAEERRVPMVPNPPLARALHKLELESEIPMEHYKAVADIIAYIWRMEAAAARARMI